MQDAVKRLREIAGDILRAECKEQALLAAEALLDLAKQVEVQPAGDPAMPVVAWADQRTLDEIARSTVNGATDSLAKERAGRFSEPLVRLSDAQAAVAAARQERPWVALTDEDRTRALQSQPDMLEGFLKTWGWLHFAKAIEAICREKNECDPSNSAPSA